MLRWLARLLGVAAVGVGIGIALMPFDTDVTIPVEPAFEGTSECRAPIREVLSDGVDGATLVDEPGATPTLTEGFGCEEPARRRLAVSAGSVAAGLLVLGVAARRRAPGRTVPIEADVDGIWPSDDPASATPATPAAPSLVDGPIPRPAVTAPVPIVGNAPRGAGETEPRAGARLPIVSGVTPDAAAPDDLADVRQHYQSIQEEDRLATGLDQLELVRTRQILRRHLPAEPAAILDVGGGTGVHAAWLAEAGHSVHVVDLAPRHVELVNRTLGARGVTAVVGDARRLDAPNSSYDIVLLFGPLYHLLDRADRLEALVEARRVVRPGGMVAVAAISRFASLFDGLTRGFLFDAAFRDIVGGDLRDGQHRNHSDQPSWFTTAYFHHPDDLAAEIGEAGLELDELVGVEGMAGWMPHLEEQWATPEGRRVIVEAAEGIEAEPALLGLSAHLLAIARRPGGSAGTGGPAEDPGPRRVLRRR